MLGGQEAQDASQEVWVRVWANMKSFRGERLFDLALQGHGQHLPDLPTQRVAPQDARSRRSWRISPYLQAATIPRRPRSTRNAGKRSR